MSVCSGKGIQTTSMQISLWFNRIQSNKIDDVHVQYMNSFTDILRINLVHALTVHTRPSFLGGLGMKPGIHIIVWLG